MAEEIEREETAKQSTDDSQIVDNQDKTENSVNKDETENSDKNDNSSEEKDQKENKNDKKVLVKKILIGVIAFLSLLILIFTTLYFIGFFEPEQSTQEISATDAQKIQTPTQSKNIQTMNAFDLSRLDTNRLNKELEKLTSRNMEIEQKAIEIEKKEDEKKLLEDQKQIQLEELKKQEESLNEEKKIIEERKQELENQKNELLALKEEALKIKDLILKEKEEIENKINQIKQDSTPIIENDLENEQATNSNFNDTLDYDLIVVAVIKGKLYRDYLDRVLRVDTDIKLCRDDQNRIVIYSGPYYDKINRDEKLALFKKSNFKNSFLKTLSKEDFDRQCNY